MNYNLLFNKLPSQVTNVQKSLAVPPVDAVVAEYPNNKGSRKKKRKRGMRNKKIDKTPEKKKKKKKKKKDDTTTTTTTTTLPRVLDTDTNDDIESMISDITQDSVTNIGGAATLAGYMKQKQVKSRPAALASMCYALETQAKKCYDAGKEFTLTPETLLHVLHEQSGTKNKRSHNLNDNYRVNYEAVDNDRVINNNNNNNNNSKKMNPEELMDKFIQEQQKQEQRNHDILRKLEGVSVFRPDVHMYGLRHWPELVLGPILDALDELQAAWFEPDQYAKKYGIDVDESKELERIRDPMPNIRTTFAPARPLW